MKYDPFAAAFNAITNGTDDPVSEADIIAMLRSGDGKPGMVRSLFEDCPLEVLERLAMHCGMSGTDLRASLRMARQKHAAANAGFMAEEEGR